MDNAGKFNIIVFMQAMHEHQFPLKDGVRAILEHARMAVTCVPIEVNRTLEVPVDFVAESNGHRFAVKCLDTPEQLDPVILQKLADFSSCNGVDQLMVIGNGSFSPQISSLVPTLPVHVQLTDRAAYEGAVNNLPPQEIQKLSAPEVPQAPKSAFDDIPAESLTPPVPPAPKSAFDDVPAESLTPKSAFDDIPAESLTPKSAFDDIPAESHTEGSEYGADSGYGSGPGDPDAQEYGADRQSQPVHLTPPQRKSSFGKVLMVIVLGGAALYIGYPKLFGRQNDAAALARAAEESHAKELRKKAEENKAAVQLGNTVAEGIVQTRKTAGLETGKLDTSVLKLALSQMGTELEVGDEVTQQQLEMTLLQKNPTFRFEASSVLEAESPEALIAQVKSWPSLTEEEFTHFGSITRNGKNGNVWTWIFGGIEVSREEKLDLALEKGGFFSLVCSHCQRESSYELTAHAKYLVMPPCTSCGLTTHVFGPDTEGNYRRACDFLTGFQIPREKVEEYLPINHEYREPEDHVLAHWKVILDRCDYEYDTTQRGEMARDVWKLPSQTWDERVGDCEDTTILLTDALISAGFEARVAFGTWEGQGHAWCVVKVGNRQRILESTMAHTGAVSLRSIIDVGKDYVATCMFDRDSIYLRKNAGNLSTPDYFSETYWRQLKINKTTAKPPTELSALLGGKPTMPLPWVPEDALSQAGFHHFPSLSGKKSRLPTLVPER